MKENYLRLLFILFYIFRIYFNQSCDDRLTQSVGLEGLSKPEYVQLKTFPTINLSCCSQKDEVTIYSNLFQSNEYEQIRNNLEMILKKYLKFTKVLQQADKFIQQIHNKINYHESQILNCKVLTKVLVRYKLDNLISKLEEILQKMYHGQLQTYLGFYPALCNAKNHDYFDYQLKRLTYSKKFCHNILDHTFPFLTFFHLDINKYLNLISKILLTCDHNGEYQQDVQIPLQYQFLSIPETEKQLLDCKSSIDQKNWFQQCKVICEKFNITKITDFFLPKINEIEVYSKFLEDLLSQRRDQEITEVQIKDFKIEDDGNNLDQNPFFSSYPIPIIHFKDYNTAFDDKGVSLYSEGKNSLFSSSILEQINIIQYLKNESDVPEEDQIKENTVQNAISANSISYNGNLCILLFNFFLIVFV